MAHRERHRVPSPTLEGSSIPRPRRVLRTVLVLAAVGVIALGAGCRGAGDGGPASTSASPASVSDATVAGQATAPATTPATMPWRPPTERERAGIIATLSREFAESRSCFARDVYRVATIDRRYALWSSAEAGLDHRAANGCLLGNGYIILQRRNDGSWARLVDWSWTSAPCSVVGAPVATDLTGLPCA